MSSEDQVKETALWFLRLQNNISRKSKNPISNEYSHPQQSLPNVRFAFPAHGKVVPDGWMRTSAVQVSEL